MSILKSNITAKRIAKLSREGEILFHANDLENLWKIKNPNTLRMTLKRYVDTGLLHRIYRGFYSLLPLKELPSLLLGTKILHTFCYITTETILSAEGYINQIPSYHTFVSEKSLKLTVCGHNFLCRKLHEKYLYNSADVYKENGVQKASTARAVADMLYFNPTYHFDKEPDWEKVKNIQQQVGYPLTVNRYDTAS